MNAAQGHQQQLEQMQWESEHYTWHCVYCGKEMPPSCPHPNAFQCCGETGHTEPIYHE